MDSYKQIALLESIISNLEIPESYYEKATKRYEDLGDWLGRPDSSLLGYDPHVFVQGSFRLGTVIRPLDNTEEYDLDLCCKLRKGITEKSHTQKELKSFVGEELEKYRRARSIQHELESKHRCWRLEYQDELSFHMDIVPSIPSGSQRNLLLLNEMRQTGVDRATSQTLSDLTVLITDDRKQSFYTISDEWEISNPEGYAKWFEISMNSVTSSMFAEHLKVDTVPAYKRKTPLQRSIQLLKRHRDQMFKDYPDRKPISIIVTTLAARAYQGETNIAASLESILARMGDFVRNKEPRVPNPVNPKEDFADRWKMPKYKDLRLEENFRGWLQQARNDFRRITTTENREFFSEETKDVFGVTIGDGELHKLFGASTQVSNPNNIKGYQIEDAPKPWKA